MKHSDKPMPGLKRRVNRDGTERLVWVARADLGKAGYTPKTVPLHYAIDESALISAACLRLQSEMLEWAAGHKQDSLRFDGTVGSLVRRYQRDPASPYANLKWNTSRVYDQTLGTIEAAMGKRVLSTIGLSDFRRWYDTAKKPPAENAPERINKASKIIALFRRLCKYGTAAELPGCARLVTILEASRFKQPGRRRTKLELHHVEAFVSMAIDMGRLSLAIGTSLQFETTLRQKDVIGEWEPIRRGNQEPSGILLRGRRWVNGLTWSDIDADMRIFKETTKTGAIAAHDLTLYPIVMGLLNLVPADGRVGPLVIDEKSGRPYATDGYAREWRVIADAAGIPKMIKNMDARAGGISEADEAGADIDHIRSAAAHTQASTTVRYVRGTIEKSRKVASLRATHRIAKNVP